ncbi:hypothetical protein GCM10025776_14910 [Corallincola platygyrae]
MQPVFAAHLVVAVGEDRPPYVMAGGKRGLEVAILREALATRGHTFESFQASNRRLTHLLGNGSADAAVGVQERPDGNYYSAPFIAYRYVALSKKKQHLRLQNISDLTGLRVVTSQNTYRQLGGEFAAMFSPQRIQNSPVPLRYTELPNPIQAVKMFWHDRADTIIIELNVFKALSAQLDDNFDTRDPLVVHPIFSEATQFQVSFKDEQLRNEFNEGLAQLHNTGRYKELVSRYLN